MSEKRSNSANSVRFNYQKSNQFRVVYASGVYGGAGPSGMLHMAFYNERGAIPRITELRLVDGAPAGEEVRVEGLEGFVREVEVDVTMDISSAIQFSTWLNRHLKAAKDRLGISDEDWALMAGEATKDE